jgi:hypothetical protein
MELFVLLAADAADPISALWQVGREYGIFAAMVVFFTAWSYFREKQLNARNDTNDAFIRNVLIATLNNNTKAFEHVAAQLAAAKKE